MLQTLLSYLAQNLRWCRVGLLKDGGVVKCVAENQRGYTWRSGSELGKLLR